MLKNLDPKFLDDVARMASGAVSLVSTVRRQIQSDLKDRMEAKFAHSGENAALKDEIVRLQAMVSKLREEQELMKAQFKPKKSNSKTASSSVAQKKKPSKKKK
jgi:uncharacterized small protein (DUF1192 family)